jgi:hypothetical protein
MINIKTIMQMKQSMLLMAGALLALSSCQKDESISQGSAANESAALGKSTPNIISTVLPATFTHKILAEEFVGNSYGDVPLSNEMLNTISTNSNNSVYVASFHNSDMLETGSTDPLMMALPGGSGAAYPSACINRNDLAGSRFVTYNNYQNMVNAASATTADCGVAITSSYSNTKAVIQVFAGFNANMTGNYTMNVYLVENNVMDKVGSLAQASNFDADKFTSFYQMGNPIYGYTHNNVVRKVVTPTMGSAISPSATVAGGMESQVFKVDMPVGVDPANCSVIAFITKLNSNGIADDICNVQKAKLGASKNWN